MNVRAKQRLEMSESTNDAEFQRLVIREFHRLYYEREIQADQRSGLHNQTFYHGIETHKCPLDLWIYQEILHDLKPALVIELGTYIGGTTLFLAHQLDALGQGSVLSIDHIRRDRPEHSRIQYLTGDTTDPGLLNEVRSIVSPASSGPVLVIHDADHRREQVLADLDAYAPFVTSGSYLIVEDTNVNGHPVLADWGPGPWEAVDQFLETHAEFERDTTREKFMMTYNPGGFLRKTL